LLSITATRGCRTGSSRASDPHHRPHPLEDEGCKLYLNWKEEYLANLPRLGGAIVVTKGSRIPLDLTPWSMRKPRRAKHGGGSVLDRT